MKHKTKVFQIICDYYGMDLEEFLANFKCQKREYVKLRQIVCYFLKKYTHLSLARIELIFYKDHGTVLFGIRTINNLLTNNKQLIHDIKELNKDIEPLLTYKPKSVKRRLTPEEMFKLIELWSDSETATDLKEFYYQNEDIELK